MLADGAVAPDFSLDGWSLSEALRKGPVLLAFFKISCPTCQLAFPFLQRLNDSVAPEALQIVPISQDNRAGTSQFQDRLGISIPVQLDPAPAYAASNLYGIRNVPSLFLIEPRGVISMAVNGFSKRHLETLAERFGTPIFHPGEDVPAFRPG